MRGFDVSGVGDSDGRRTTTQSRAGTRNNFGTTTGPRSGGSGSGSGVLPGVGRERFRDRNSCRRPHVTGAAWRYAWGGFDSRMRRTASTAAASAAGSGFQSHTAAWAKRTNRPTNASLYSFDR